MFGKPWKEVVPVDCGLPIDVVDEGVDGLGEGDLAAAISDEDDEGDDDDGDGDTGEN